MLSILDSETFKQNLAFSVINRWHILQYGNYVFVFIFYLYQAREEHSIRLTDSLKCILSDT